MGKNCDSGGAGHGAYAHLRPIEVQNQHVVGLYLHGHGKQTAGLDASTLNSVEDKEEPTNNLLEGLSNREGVRYGAPKVRNLRKYRVIPYRRTPPYH